ncbi:VOC family protein [Enterococcus sp. AZ126]|uniref:VOC family protein n=1 Tax=Enterococcus sp. AZ126 TaxID=2774635 RepID=UPI003F21B743
MSKFSPCLWFDGKVEEAAELYVNAFDGGEINKVDYYVDSEHQPKGSVLTVSLTLAGQEVILLNGGPEFDFTPAISFFVECETEEQIDKLWETLSHKGEILMEFETYPFSKKYGWLKDQYGVSWQLSLSETSQSITPSFLFTGKQFGKAEEAMNQWIEIFGEGTIEFVQKNQDGTVAQALFTMHGQPFRVMDSGEQHNFTFTMATSFYVYCKDQAEINRLWDAVTAKGKEWPCGWMEDEYGVCWQTVTADMEKLFDNSDPDRAYRVMQELYKMKRIDIAALRKVYEE